jgi:hypothetical protein
MKRAHLLELLLIPLASTCRSERSLRWVEQGTGEGYYRDG